MRKHHRGSYLCTGLQVLLLLGNFVIGLGAILCYVGWFWQRIGTDKARATFKESPAGHRTLMAAFCRRLALAVRAASAMLQAADSAVPLAGCTRTPRAPVMLSPVRVLA